MKVTLVMFKDGERRDFPIAGASTVIGRKEECTLRIPTRDVSRRHCEIVINEHKATVKDLGSSNGTYVNGKRIAETVLGAGDQLRVGPVTFFVQIDGKPMLVRPDLAGPPPAAAAAKAMAPPTEDELFDLGDSDFDLDDPITALNNVGDDEDEDDDKPPPKRK